MPPAHLRMGLLHWRETMNGEKAQTGDLAGLIAEIRTCKDGRTCPNLSVRSFYFEPNIETITDWRSGKDDFGAFSGPLDRRVVFVCESPGPQARLLENTAVRRCWAVTRQDRKFFDLRKAHGLENCHLTNSVKCGVRRGGRHSNEEMEHCSGFLSRELELIAPLVAVGVGGNAMLALRRVARRMTDPPVLFQMTHYSARGRHCQEEWPHETQELLRLLRRLRPRTEWPSGGGA